MREIVCPEGYAPDNRLASALRGYVKEDKTRIWGKPRWLFVIEAKHVNWRSAKYSKYFKSEAEALTALTEWLDRWENKNRGRRYA